MSWLTVYFRNKKYLAAVCFTVFAGLATATWLSIQKLPLQFSELILDVDRQTYWDRYGERLNLTYKNQWNIHDQVPVHDVPEFLQRAFIVSEDKRFFQHSGVDWLARLNALQQNLMAGETVRGASTITEQVVRLIHPRPRTLWSRWVEGFEAILLERHFSKPDIFEFYLNQVPYEARRRGIVQAAHYYFDRDITTLNRKEMLALTVLVRSPRWLDPKKQSSKLERSILELARRMEDVDPPQMGQRKLQLAASGIKVNARHFIEYVKNQHRPLDSNTPVVNTTLDAGLQREIQRMLDTRLDRLKDFNVNNAAVLVVDHGTNEILAWVVGYAGRTGKKFNQMDPVVIKRQPGSALKPLLYARAMAKGWTAATMLDDSPLEESVGLGMHTYHNYSRDHYGLISLREALGNSLNIPAIRAIQFVGAGDFLVFLHDLGINSLSGHPNVYGDGIALGNGEITLFELVQAYTVLARMGDFKPLTIIDGEAMQVRGHRVLSEDIASLIADIMSDPAAREKEFGRYSILNFPHQSAVKTGTSSDYRDAWAVGFDDQYTAGVWMGNLDYKEMNGITGSRGPAPVLRAVFNELNKNREFRPLYFSGRLNKHRVCIETGYPADEDCEARDEWFITGTHPGDYIMADTAIRLRKPSQGLLMAMDPRIPDEHEYFEFKLTDFNGLAKVNWFVNGRQVGTTGVNSYLWKVSRGKYVARAEVWRKGNSIPVVTEDVAYTVN